MQKKGKIDTFDHFTFPCLSVKGKLAVNTEFAGVLSV